METNDITIGQLNAGVRKVATKMLAKTLDNVVTQGVVDTGNLFKRSRFKLLYDYDEVEVISLIMPRYGFIQQTGSGLGSTAAGNGKLTGGVERPTISPAAASYMEELADYVAAVMANRGLENIDFGVKMK